MIDNTKGTSEGIHEFKTQEQAGVDGTMGDVCERCGMHIGHGLPVFHLGICDDCEGTPADRAGLLEGRGGEPHALPGHVANDQEAVSSTAGIPRGRFDLKGYISEMANDFGWSEATVLELILDFLEDETADSFSLLASLLASLWMICDDEMSGEFDDE